MPSLVRYIYNTYFNRLKLGRVEIWDSGSAVNLIQAPLQEALDVVGSVDVERPPVGADIAGRAMVRDIYRGFLNRPRYRAFFLDF